MACWQEWDGCGGFQDPPVHANAPLVGCAVPRDGVVEGQRTHSFTMWGVDGRPHLGLRENLSTSSTPSLFPLLSRTSSCSPSGTTTCKVPLGVNPRDDWHYTDSSTGGRRVPLYDGRARTRKGIDIATKAFRTVFGEFHPRSNRARPVLIVKSRHHMPDVNGAGMARGR